MTTVLESGDVNLIAWLKGHPPAAALTGVVARDHCPSCKATALSWPSLPPLLAAPQLSTGSALCRSQTTLMLTQPWHLTSTW